MMRKRSTQINDRIERFQDRWDTDPAFRRAVNIAGMLVAGVFLVTLLSLSVAVSNSLLASANGGAPVASNSTSSQDKGAATFTIPPNPSSPAGNTPGAVPVATTTFAPPTATTAPTQIPVPGQTPSPSPTAGTPTGTPQPSVVLTASQQGVWTAGQAAQIQGIQTTPTQKNAQVQIVITYVQGCTQTLPNVTLDGNGTNPNVNFVLPTCFHGQNVNVSAAMSIVGVANSTNQLSFIANGAP